MPYWSLTNSCASSTPYALNILAVDRPLPVRTLAEGQILIPGMQGSGQGAGNGQGNGQGRALPIQGCFPADRLSSTTTYSYFVSDGSNNFRYNSCADPACSYFCQRSDTAPVEKEGCDLGSFTTVDVSSTPVTGSKLRVSYYPDNACIASPLYFYDIPYNPTCVKGAQVNFTRSYLSASFLTNLECSDSECNSCTNQPLTWPVAENCNVQSNRWGVYYSKSEIILPSVAPVPAPAPIVEQSASSSVNVGLISVLAVTGFLIVVGVIGLIFYHRRKPNSLKQFSNSKKSMRASGAFMQTEFVPEMDRETFLLYLDAQKTGESR
jgi:hypothetical protein